MNIASSLRPLVANATQPVATQEHFACSNIALCKYWGKRNTQLNLPVNPSLSISLGHLGTHTRLTPLAHEGDEIWLNSQLMPVNSIFAKRISNYLDLFRLAPDQGFRVNTRNNIPTAAGLASSASGFAALAKAVNESFGLSLHSSGLSVLARLGSGSASRSIEKGFVEWQMGQREDGLDSIGVPLQEQWSGLCIGLLKIDENIKSVDSRSGMQRTIETSALYQSWPAKAFADLQALKEAIAAQDFNSFGKISEQNAMSMHATMLSSWPPLCYWQVETLEKMKIVWGLREQGLPLYFTMDAGANIKLLFERINLEDVVRVFPEMEVIHPFGYE